MQKILIVTNDFYSGSALADTLRAVVSDAEVSDVYRVYHLPDKLSRRDIVIGRGVCKDSDDYGASRAVYFDTRGYAKKAGARYISAPLKLFGIETVYILMRIALVRAFTR